MYRRSASATWILKNLQPPIHFRRDYQVSTKMIDVTVFKISWFKVGPSFILFEFDLKVYTIDV